MRKTTLVVLGLIALTAAPAFAQRVNPLEGQPAVRKRLLLRNTRLEVTPQVGVTLNRDFFHTILAGGKVEFHLNDWLSVGGNFAAAAANIKSGLQDNVVAQLPNEYNNSTEYQLVPSKQMAQDSMAKIKYLVAAQANITPFFGKMALFSKLFFNYDFYAFGGVGGIGLGATCAGADSCSDPGGTGVTYGNPSTGFKFGATWGVGLHMFFSNWGALNFELRDIIIRDNLAGRDMNWDVSSDGTNVQPPKITGSDASFDHVFTVMFGLSVYLPPSVDVSR